MDELEELSPEEIRLALEMIAAQQRAQSEKLDGPHRGKLSKKEARYDPFGTREAHCSICTMFRDPHNCTAVRGEISRTAVCAYFQSERRVNAR